MYTKGTRFYMEIQRLARTSTLIKATHGFMLDTKLGTAQRKVKTTLWPFFIAHILLSGAVVKTQVLTNHLRIFIRILEIS